MSSKLKYRIEKNESLWQVGQTLLKEIADYFISFYMLLIIVVMPLYCEEGFRHIGTDKYTFFRWVSLNAGKFLLPVLVLLALFSLLRLVKEGKGAFSLVLSSLKKNVCVTDIFVLCYGVSVVVSYLGSDYRDMALWGTKGWYMGMFPQLILVAVYFGISRLWKKKNWLVMLFLPISALVFVLGLLNRFGIFPIDMQVDNPEFISTIGNINWYCGYFVSVFFMGFYLLWQRGEQMVVSKWKLRELRRRRAVRVLLTCYVALGFATLVTQGSMSGIMALGVVFVVAFAMSAGDCEKMLRFWQLVLLFAVVCVMLFGVRRIFPGRITYTDGIIDLLTASILPFGLAVVAACFVAWIYGLRKRNDYPEKVFGILARLVVISAVGGLLAVVAMIAINTLYPGSLGGLSQYDFFTFSWEWGSKRGASWRAGIMCFERQDILHKLIGAGPDCMEGFLNSARCEDVRNMLSKTFSSLRLTNAHNEWLTVLVNLGIFGCISYAGMMISAILCFMRAKEGNPFMKGACGLCLLAYTVNSMVSFQQSMGMATIFVVLAIGRAYHRDK